MRHFFSRSPRARMARNFLLALLLLPGAPACRAGLPAGVRVIRDIPYVPNAAPRQRLDLYLPEQTGAPRPLLGYIHGGGWCQGSKSGCPYVGYVNRGYVVASIEYRFSQDAIYPAQIEDCKAAIRWLRAHAAEYGIDPKRMGATGESAGGHLVALLGTTGETRQFDVGPNLDQSSAVQCVADFFGPTDFLHYGIVPKVYDDSPNSLVARLLGITPAMPLAAQAAAARLASPIYFITKNAAPFLILQGDHDPLVPLQQSQILNEALKKAGVESTLIVIPGAGHGGPGFGKPEIYGQVADFLDLHLRPELDLARTAQVTVSGEKPEFPATNATDGNRATEWVAAQGKYDLQDPKQMRPWIKLQWAQPVLVGRLVISDRADPKQNIHGGKVLFSDGSTVDADDIPIDGTPCEASFPARKVDWLKINFYSSRGNEPGLAELEVYADPRPMPKAAQAGPLAPGTVVDINGNDPQIKTEGNIRGGEWSAAMWCPFAGTKVTLLGNTGPANGMGDVYLDGIFQKRVDWYSAQDSRGVTLFSADNLADGKHLLGVMARGIKRAESSGTSINWTGIQYVAAEHPDQFTAVKRTQFDPDAPLWLDNNGNQIQCHMGGISYFDGTYYMMGCDWRGKKLPDFGYGWSKNVGFTVYSSPDLMNWTYRGNFLKPVNDPKSPLYDYAHGIGRVRLLRARGTGKYVAMFQIVDSSFSSTDDPDNADTVNNVGIAIADKPEGPYEWHGFLQYNGKKVTAADNAVFTDEDGKQYFVNGPPTPGNISDWLYELAPDCLSAVKIKHLCTGGEGDAFFKHDGVYYLLHSHLLGMTPTDNFYHTATNIWGPWTAKGNIAHGEHSEGTFRTQTMDVVPVAGKKDAFIWIGDSLRNGEGNGWNRTVWLPITFNGTGEMEVRWRDSWDMSVFGH